MFMKLLVFLSYVRPSTRTDVDEWHFRNFKRILISNHEPCYYRLLLLLKSSSYLRPSTRTDADELRLARSLRRLWPS